MSVFFVFLFLVVARDSQFTACGKLLRPVPAVEVALFVFRIACSSSAREVFFIVFVFFVEAQSRVRFPRACAMCGWVDFGETCVVMVIDCYRESVSAGGKGGSDHRRGCSTSVASAGCLSFYSLCSRTYSARMPRTAYCMMCMIVGEQKWRLSFKIQHTSSTINCYLKIGIVIHDNGHHADVRQQALGATDHVRFGEPQLAGRVQAAIVHLIVVALGQELELAVTPAEQTGSDRGWFRHMCLLLGFCFCTSRGS